MADVFVSYSRNDLVRVEMLIRALEAHGISMWWDRSLEQGVGFASLIRQEIAKDKSVIVCWSESAAKSEWVQSEADEARHHAKYLGVLIVSCRAPPPFNSLNNANLQSWDGTADDRQLLALLRKVGEQIGRQDIAELAEAEETRLAEDEKRGKASEEAERVGIERDRQKAQADAARAAAVARDEQSLIARRLDAKQQSALLFYFCVAPIALLTLWIAYLWPLAFLSLSDLRGSNPLSLIGFVLLLVLLVVPSFPSFFVGLAFLLSIPRRLAWPSMPVAILLGAVSALLLFGGYLIVFPPAEQPRASNPVSAVFENRRAMNNSVADDICERSRNNMESAFYNNPDVPFDQIAFETGFEALKCVERFPENFSKDVIEGRRSAARDRRASSGG